MRKRDLKDWALQYWDPPAEPGEEVTDEGECGYYTLVRILKHRWHKDVKEPWNLEILCKWKDSTLATWEVAIYLILDCQINALLIV